MAKPWLAWMRSRRSGGAMTRCSSTSSSEASVSSAGASRAAMRRSAQTSLSPSGVRREPRPRSICNSGAPNQASPWRIVSQACRYDNPARWQAAAMLPVSATWTSSSIRRGPSVSSLSWEIVHWGRMEILCIAMGGLIVTIGEAAGFSIGIATRMKRGACTTSPQRRRYVLIRVVSFCRRAGSRDCNKKYNDRCPPCMTQCNIATC